MNWFSALVTYIIIWWLVLFMVLPWGVRTIDTSDVERGHAPSAPREPKMLRKVAATTVIAGVLFAIVYAVIAADLISFRN